MRHARAAIFLHRQRRQRVDDRILEGHVFPARGMESEAAFAGEFLDETHVARNRGARRIFEIFGIGRAERRRARNEFVMERALRPGRGGEWRLFEIARLHLEETVTEPTGAAGIRIADDHRSGHVGVDFREAKLLAPGHDWIGEILPAYRGEMPDQAPLAL